MSYNAPATPDSTRPTRSGGRHRRRGSAYVLVLGVSMLLTVCGATVLTVARLEQRVLSQGDDAVEAAALAEAAVDQALAVTKSDASWRTRYTHDVASTAKSLGRGTLQFKFVDQTDTNLGNNAAHDVRVYGIGKVGNAVRVYSVRLTPSGAALDLLKTVAHAGGDAQATGTVTLNGGNLSSNTKFTVQSTGNVLGTVEAPDVDKVGLATEIREPVPVKSMPKSSGAWDTYSPGATTIPFTSLTGGIIEKCLLSPKWNPWNTAGASAGNDTGVYHIRVPTGSTLTIRNCRLVATLMVTLEAGAKLTTTNSYLWDPPRKDYPSLLVNALGTATITFNGYPMNLSEFSAGTNFNPTHTPYPYPDGAGDESKSDGDTYPPEFHGLMHVMGSGFWTTFTSYFTAKGTLLVDDKASFGSNVKLTLDSGLYTSPPAGYTGGGDLIPVAGTWRWESAQ